MIYCTITIDQLYTHFYKSSALDDLLRFLRLVRFYVEELSDYTNCKKSIQFCKLPSVRELSLLLSWRLIYVDSGTRVCTIFTHVVWPESTLFSFESNGFISQTKIYIVSLGLDLVWENTPRGWLRTKITIKVCTTPKDCSYSHNQ